MADAASIAEDDIVKLHRFHREHFSPQNVPDIRPTQAVIQPAADAKRYLDLGYYEDGVRRTLTDEQIAMFRHSEIQRLLADRRRKKEAEEEHRQRQSRKRKASHNRIDVAADKPTLFDSDSVVHARTEVEKLSYDEAGSQPKTEQPTTFEWPVLGS